MKKQKWVHNIFWLCYYFFMVGVSFLGSYMLVMIINSYAGMIPRPWEFLVYGIINLLIIFGLFSLSSKIIHTTLNRSDLLKATLNALEKIAKGNFDVFIEQNEHGPFEKITESINRMVKELGSMEQLRQDFISNISHEFQSPLTSISGYAALLRKEGATLRQLEYATIIEEESKRLSKLSENLLWLSALEVERDSVTKDSFRLDRQVENAVLLLEPQWRAKNIIPETSLPKVIIYGNENLLKQVWINLLVNAIKFTSENGEIEVSLKQDDKSVVFTIADNGIGIAQSDQMHIFERFYKVDKSRDRSLGGNGLGLALVKKIVNIHRGVVTVESALGKGTMFKVILPRE